MHTQYTCVLHTHIRLHIYTPTRVPNLIVFITYGAFIIIFFKQIIFTKFQRNYFCIYNTFSIINIFHYLFKITMLLKCSRLIFTLYWFVNLSFSLFMLLLWENYFELKTIKQSLCRASNLKLSLELSKIDSWCTISRVSRHVYDKYCSIIKKI